MIMGRELGMGNGAWGMRKQGKQGKQGEKE